MDNENVSVVQPKCEPSEWKPDMTCREDYASWRQGQDGKWYGRYLDRSLTLEFNPQTYNEHFDTLRGHFLDLNTHILWKELLEKDPDTSLEFYYGVEDLRPEIVRIALYAVDSSNMEIVGSATICPNGPFRFEEIYVNETKRRMRIGTKMMNIGAKYFGWKMVRVVIDNESAIKFYRKLGFEIIGIQTWPNEITGVHEVPEDDAQKCYIMWRG